MVRLGTAATLVLLLVQASVRADRVADEKLFHSVMSRLLSSDLVAKNYPSKYAWPPECLIKSSSQRELNAYASASQKLGAKVDAATGKLRPVVLITEGYMARVVKGDENLLAVVMGHELAHVLKDHIGGGKSGTPLVDLAFDRDNELEADLEGMKCAVAAGFPYKAGLAGAIRELFQGNKSNSFACLNAEHPPWADRLAFLDRGQPQLWKAMSAFTNGNAFLEFERYVPAEQCFRAVTEDFPECYEAWANLGYARLMRYCDALETDDLRRFDIGQVVAGGFYERPRHLESLIPRGRNEWQWKNAVKALKKALDLKPDLVLPRANLALAYLIHPVGKAQTAQARKWFAEALQLAAKDLDPRENPVPLAALLVNSGVADLAAGNGSDAQVKFKSAAGLLADVRYSPLVKTLDDALLYNQALVAAASREPGTRKKAYQSLEAYLKKACPDSAWWPLAMSRYEKLAELLGQMPRSKEELARRHGPACLRVVTSVNVGKNAIALSGPTSEALDALGKESGVAIPLVPDIKLVRWHFAGAGLDLLAKDKILAIFLKTPKAPPVILQSVGVSAKPRELRVGMSETAAKAVLKDQRADSTPRPIDDPTVRYQFYPELGVAVRFGKGVVEELALAQIPRRSYAQELAR
jgi:tetratricopeptide (TPR) repeat protein